MLLFGLKVPSAYPPTYPLDTKSFIAASAQWPFISDKVVEGLGVVVVVPPILTLLPFIVAIFPSVFITILPNLSVL